MNGPRTGSIILSACPCVSVCLYVQSLVRYVQPDEGGQGTKGKRGRKAAAAAQQQATEYSRARECAAALHASLHARGVPTAAAASSAPLAHHAAASAYLQQP